MNRLLEIRVLRFLVGGGINAGATYLIYLALAPRLGDGFAFTVAYVAGIGLSYAINSLFVFRTRMEIGSALKFPVVYLVQYLSGLILVWLFVTVWELPRALSMIVIIGLNAVLAYLLIRAILTPGKTFEKM